MSAAGTAFWFARHESRLAWRDWLSMITAGRRERLRKVVIAIAAFFAFMHVVAAWTVGRYADVVIDKQTLIAVTATALLSWLLMISQAMESVTRAFYARSDLDLILASPVASDRLLGVRIATVALATTMMALPSIAVPCAFDRHGRPVGLQLVGRHRGEAALLQTAALFEQMLGLAAQLPIDPRPGTVPPAG